MITTYIFDFGNVLANFYPEKLTAPYVADETERRYLADIVFDRAVWDKLDDGTYSDEEAKAEICKSLPVEKHELACKIYDGWIDNLTPVAGMVELIEDIRRKGDKKLYLLSNISRGFAERYKDTPWIKKLFDNFDGLVLTGTLGIVKPTREIFEYMFNTYNFTADECIFVDDSEKNIKGAKAAGIKGYLFDGDARKLREEMRNDPWIRTCDLRIRDPFVVVHGERYYMYRSGDDGNVYVHTSRDLENWSEAKTVYTLSEDSWGYTDLWAPEVHLYDGRYYLFLSILGKNGLRGTEISVCDTPDGTFVPITNAPATPADRSCIDATLFVENGTPYIAYSADWPHNYVPERDCYVGEIWALEMARDLKNVVGEPFLLFKSDEAPVSKMPNICEYEGKKVTRYGSDAPFIQKLSTGSLYLTWSPYPDKTYIVAAAVSDSMRGKWRHLEKPLFDGHGGHAMFFDDLCGKRKMCIHCPERPPEERALFLDVKECDGRLEIID